MKKSIKNTLGNIKLFGFNGLSIYQVLSFLLKSIKNNNYRVKSSAIAFDLFLAVFPAIIFVVTLIPIIPIPNFQELLLEEIKIISPPSAYHLFENTLNNLINNKYYGLLSLGLLLVIYYSSNALNTMIDVLNNSHLIQKEYKTIKQRLLSIALFLKLFALIIITVFFNYGAEIIMNFFNQNFSVSFIDIVINFSKWIFTIYSILFAISLIFRYAQSDSFKLKFINAGTLTTLIVIVVASLLLSYFFNNFSNYNKVYGSIAGLLITLIWIRICSFIIIVGFDLYLKIGLNDSEFFKNIKHEN